MTDELIQQIKQESMMYRAYLEGVGVGIEMAEEGYEHLTQEEFKLEIGQSFDEFMSDNR